MSYHLLEGNFVKFAADNIGIIEETLDGKETFHATQMAAFQCQGHTAKSAQNLPLEKETAPPNIAEQLH